MTPKRVRDMFINIGSSTRPADLVEAISHLDEVDVNEVAELAIEHGLAVEVEALATFYTSVVRRMKFKRN